MAVAKKTAVAEDNVKQAAQMEANGDKYVAFDYEIQGEKIVVILLRDPMDAPARIMNVLGVQDPRAMLQTVELLAGAEMMAKINELDPTAGDIINIFNRWGEEIKAAGK